MLQADRDFRDYYLEAMSSQFKQDVETVAKVVPSRGPGF